MKNTIFLFFLLLHLSLFAQQPTAWNWQHQANANNEASLILMGDMNIQNRENPADAFQHILPTLQAADLRFTNLEGAFAGTDRSKNWGDVPHKFAWRHSDPEMVEGLVAAGFDVVGVANNVTYPYTALQKSLDVLDKAGIKHTGGGDNLEEAHEAVIIERKGTTFGFLQYACTVFPFDHAAKKDQAGIAEIKVHTSYQPPSNLDKPAQPPIVRAIPDADYLARMQRDISELKEKADIVVVSYHWGVSNTYEPVEYQREVARAAIESGADLILGHGPHKIQAIEMWQNRPIFFSVGNAVFDWWKGRKNPDGLMVQLTTKDQQLQSVSFVPLKRDAENNPVLYNPNSKTGKEIMKKIAEDDSRHRARIQMAENEVVVFDADFKERIPQLEKVWEIDGFHLPESAVYDKKRGVIYIGNMGDGSQQKDGFIAKIDMDGKVQKMKWLTGLDNPKGMELYENFLYVNDDQTIHKIDVTTGKIVAQHQPVGALGLNDLTIDENGTVYSNDFAGHQIFELKNGRSEVFWQHRTRGRPNGIWNEKDRLLVAMFGSGELVAVDKTNRTGKVLHTDIGRGDGIEAVGENDYLITDYDGRIFYFSPLEHLYMLQDSRGKKHTADLEYIPSEKMLIVPNHRNNTVQAFRLVQE